MPIQPHSPNAGVRQVPRRVLRKVNKPSAVKEVREGGTRHTISNLEAKVTKSQQIHNRQDSQNKTHAREEFWGNPTDLRPTWTDTQTHVQQYSPTELDSSDSNVHILMRRYPETQKEVKRKQQSIQREQRCLLAVAVTVSVTVKAPQGYILMLYINVKQNS